MPKSRAERARGRGEMPSKRALRGAQKIARQDPVRGVTSRARKRVEGREEVPDPKYGGRPGEERSKWRPPAELMSPRLRRLALIIAMIYRQEGQLEKAQRTLLEYYELPHSPNHIEWLRRLAPQIGIASHPNATVRGE